MKGRMYLWMLIWLLIIYSMVSGCRSTRVFSDQVDGIDYGQFKTFAWLPAEDSSDGSLFANPIVFQNLRNNINKEMFVRGYEIDTRSPDLLVLVHVNFREVQELVQSPVYGSYGYYYPGFYAGPSYPYNYMYYNTIPNIAGYNIQSVEFTRGTVVVDIIDTDANELIWRGWALTDITDPDDFRKDMRKIVQDIFSRYPVKRK